MSEMTGPRGEPSKVVRRRVTVARNRQRTRQGRLNRDLRRSHLDALAWSPIAERSLLAAAERKQLTGRGWDRIRKIARTIADLDDADVVDAPYIEEALTLRDAGL